MRRDDDDLWVFGYGSLMWKPGFAFAERRMARLQGWRRSFCLRSITYRGTPEAPGLVLGLDRDPHGGCDGVAFRVAAHAAADVLSYLRARELVTYAYREALLPVRLDDGAEVPALAYVVDPAHPQYAGGLPMDEQAAVIARAVGPMGPNREYLWNTTAHLRELGVTDPDLAALEAQVRGLTGT
ncbi:MAG: gamma-glutamylcyclotransferase [Rubrimonas sp.]